MLVFEDEIMKRRDSVHEVGVSRVTTQLGLIEDAQILDRVQEKTV